VVKLEPPWIQVLQEDSVTLRCQGSHDLSNHSTQWFHNGSPIPTQVQPSYEFKAKINDSGEYRCQMIQTSLSDPVHLGVISGQYLEDPRRGWGTRRGDLLIPQRLACLGASIV
jgi:hypothetical protein